MLLEKRKEGLLKRGTLIGFTEHAIGNIDLSYQAINN